MPAKLQKPTTLTLSLFAFDLAMLGSITLFYEIEQATRFYHLQNFKYPQLKTASILFVASAGIVFLSIFFYILRTVLIDKPAYTNDNLIDDNKLRIAYLGKAVVSTLLLCGGFVAVGIGFLQKAEMYAYRANRYTTGRPNMSGYTIGGAVLLAAALFFVICTYCSIKYGKEDSAHPKLWHFGSSILAIFAGASVVFGASLLTAGLTINPPKINLGMQENVTFWILVGFSLLAGGVLLRDITQSYIRYLRNQPTGKPNKPDLGQLAALRLQAKSQPGFLIGIPILTFIAAGFIIASTALIYNYPELNPDTLHFYKLSHAFALLGVGLLATGFLLKATFGTHEDDEVNANSSMYN